MPEERLVLGLEHGAPAVTSRPWSSATAPRRWHRAPKPRVGELVLPWHAAALELGLEADLNPDQWLEVELVGALSAANEWATAHLVEHPTSLDLVAPAESSHLQLVLATVRAWREWVAAGRPGPKQFDHVRGSR